jgi:hypothetical protein
MGPLRKPVYHRVFEGIAAVDEDELLADPGGAVDDQRPEEVGGQHGRLAVQREGAVDLERGIVATGEGLLIRFGELDPIAGVDGRGFRDEEADVGRVQAQELLNRLAGGFSQPIRPWGKVMGVSLTRLLQSQRRSESEDERLPALVHTAGLRRSFRLP